MATTNSIGASAQRVKSGVGAATGTVGTAIFQLDRAFIGEGIKLVPRRPTVSRGQSSIELEIRLPRNAVVRRFDLRLQARQAQAAAAGEVAQVRPAESRPGGAVLDFGLVRTVSGFDPPEGFEVEAIYLWMGTGFAPNPHWPKAGKSGGVSARFDEARTERLLVVLDRAAGSAVLAEDAVVILPEAPADLDLRIDGGVPVWTHSGPVVPGAASEPDEDSWSRNGERIVPLAGSLAPFVGDPLGEGDVTLRLTLAARIPGLLALVSVEPEISTVSRATLRVATETAPTGEGAEALDLDFASEGVKLLDLSLPIASSGPVGRLVEEIRLTFAGGLGEERTLDPVWPPDENGEPLAELLADPDHAFAVRLARETRVDNGAEPSIAPEPRPGSLDLFRLAELTAVRLPLLPGPAGAEARVALWREAAGEPAEPVENGISEPLTLDPSSGTAPSWVTFSFKSPVRVVAGERPWAVLMVGRGAVSWRMARSGGDLHPLRRGAASGPWLPLPAVFATDPDLLRRTGAVRLTGKAAKESPLAPLAVGFDGGEGSTDGSAIPPILLEVTPSAKGARFTLTFAPARRAALSRLAVTSRLAGKVTLREVDVIWRDSGDGGA